MSGKVTNIRLVGVGGQGILVASELLCDVLLASGYDVKKSEVHGMAQRGGAVNSDVRFGQTVYSPIIPDGDVDILLAFEKMEALRAISSLKAGGVVIVSEQKILPSAVAIGKLAYPSDIVERLRERAEKVIAVDALDMANRAGSKRSVNICLIGALSRFLDVDAELWESAITERFRHKGLDANLKAFALGRMCHCDLE
jgi:indolepyruvate ferredoxin oxidoreductase beta subunit